MTSDEVELTLAAADVAHRSPREWSAFVTTLRKYTDTKRDHVVNASLDELQKSQGRAQQCVQFANLMADAVKNADQARAKLASKKP